MSTDIPQYWKQFFESAANVSLSGYEEAALGEAEDVEDDDDATAAEHTATDLTTPDQQTKSNPANGYRDDDDDDFTIDSPSTLR